MEEIIRIEDVTIKLKNRVLYEKMNLSLNESERFIFLGPNGIGKSLLMELIFLGNSNELAGRYRGLEVTGKILDNNGNDLLNPGTRRKIAYVSQNEDFYKGSTIKGVCETACHGVGLELDEEQLDYLLEVFGILHKKNLKLKNNVSFGEGKIVHLISRILKLRATNLLLLDEPLNHLSFKNSKVFNDVIKAEIEKNPKLAIIMISHCRAMDFANQAWVYDTNSRSIVKRSYSSYDCFTKNEYSECF